MIGLDVNNVQSLDIFTESDMAKIAAQLNAIEPSATEFSLSFGLESSFLIILIAFFTLFAFFQFFLVKS